MGCNQGVLKSKELVIKEQRKLIRELKAMKGCQHYMLGQSESDHVDAPIPANQLVCISNRKCPLRTQSLGPAVMNRQVAANDKDVGSRKSLRRRSICSKHDLYELNEDECEAKDESIPLLTLARDDPMNDDSKNQVKSSRSISNALTYKVKEEVEEIEPIGIQYPPERRSSIGRPLRRAAEKPYCEADTCKRFLADRFVRGTCPICKYASARGDQCEQCGNMLNPAELIDPKCKVCGNTPAIRDIDHLFLEFRDIDHLFLELPLLNDKLVEYINNTSVAGSWSQNAIQATNAWLKEGLKKRCITRDLKWGVPVPHEKYKEKVFYVWFDAPIGYISITA